ncbi:hypothetical protein Psi01_41540 [Planobispora siamensis]|uniref:Uncharacterized protein n=2 Tax=Planobispora siamensis TaxID=936338 RepID=A0A8J3SHR2_9ACTN|nr:hypothetical protein Psi01_41540 [Planobispora siamensis]
MAAREPAGREAAATVTRARRGPNRRLLGLAAGVTGVAAAATVAFTLIGGAGNPAFAVEERADGSVEVRIDEFREPEELEAALAGKGVTAVVDYLPQGQTCREPRGERGEAGRPDEPMQVQVTGGGGITFRIGKGQVGAGETLVLAVSFDRARPEQAPAGMSLAVVRGAVAPCEAVPMDIPRNGRPAGPEPTGPVTHERSGGDDGPSLNTDGG